MKYLFSLLMALLCGTMANAQTDLVLKDVTVEKGATEAVASIELSTLATDASGFQCDIVCPNGVTISGAKRGAVLSTTNNSGKSLYVLYDAEQADGSTRYLVYADWNVSGSKGCFVYDYVGDLNGDGTISMADCRLAESKGYDRSLLKLNLLLDPYLAEGTHNIQMKNIEVANGKGEKLESYKETTAKLTVGGATPEEKPTTDITKYDNIIYVNSAEVMVNSLATLSLQMNNKIGVTGFQCDVVLPDGITIAQDEDGFDLINLSLDRTTAKKTDYFNSAIQPDGSTRIMCSSTKSYTFDGNNGEIATIGVNIDKNLTDGEYPIILKNIVISDATSGTVEIDYVKTTITVKTYTLGDANGDSKINVGDFTAIANYIMGTPAATFIEKAGDVNEDEKINVGDLTGVANLILYGNVKGATAARAKSASIPSTLSIADQAITAGKEIVVDVNINGDYRFSGYQFDMVLPEGVTVKDAYLSNERTDSKMTDFFTSEMINENTLRVLCASTTGAEFDGTAGSIARIILVADDSFAGNEMVSVENIMLSTNADVQMPEATSFALHMGTTGINNIKNANTRTAIYNMGGQRVSENTKGIVIVNGKKFAK